MPRLLRIGASLARIDGRLITDADGAPCCCGPGSAAKFVECCDADPALWIDSAIVDGCPGVKVGDLCYRPTGQTATIADLIEAGVEVLRSFNPNTDDGCTSGCFDGRCRECPTECCITGYLPGCLTTTPRRCCLLGSGYILRYRKVVEYRRTGPIVAGYVVIDNGIATCYPGFDPGVVVEWTETTTATMIHAGTRNTGESCSGLSPSANYVREKIGREWQADSATFDSDTRRWVIVNPRYRDIREFEQNNTPLFARGEFPTILYVDTGSRTPEGIPIGNGCNYRREYRRCLIDDPTGVDECPRPGNPITLTDVSEIVGEWDCERGTQTLTETTTEYACPGEANQAAMVGVRTTRHEWTVEILSREGCEVQSCSDIGPDPNGGGSGLIGVPEGGCTGCRQERGL